MDEMTTTEPCRRIRSGRQARAETRQVVRLTRRLSAHASSAISAAVPAPGPPAFATSVSMPPNRVLAASTTPAMSVGGGRVGGHHQCSFSQICAATSCNGAAPPPDQHHRAAVGGQPARHRRADPGPGASDHRHPPPLPGCRALLPAHRAPRSPADRRSPRCTAIPALSAPHRHHSVRDPARRARAISLRRAARPGHAVGSRGSRLGLHQHAAQDPRAVARRPRCRRMAAAELAGRGPAACSGTPGRPGRPCRRPASARRPHRSRTGSPGWWPGSS